MAGAAERKIQIAMIYEHPTVDFLYEGDIKEKANLRKLNTMILGCASGIKNVYKSGFPQKVLFEGPIAMEAYFGIIENKFELGMKLRTSQSGTNTVTVLLGKRIYRSKDDPGMEAQVPTIDGQIVDGWISSISGFMAHGGFQIETEMEPGITILLKKQK